MVQLHPSPPSPMAAGNTPDCPDTPANPLAMFALADEELRCSACGKFALALHWRTVGEEGLRLWIRRETRKRA
jgi:hypothetical protein